MRGILAVLASLVFFGASASATERERLCTEAFHAARDRCIDTLERPERATCMQEETRNLQRCLSGDTAPSPLTVTSPRPGETIREYALTVTGTISGLRPSYTVTGQGLPGEIAPDGSFVITPVWIEPGPNILVVELYDRTAQQTVAVETIALTLLPPSEAIGPIAMAEGGTIEVTNPDSRIFGARFTIPPGALRRDVYARLVHDPAHTPNPPAINIQVGEPVSIDPTGEQLRSPAEIRIPVRLDQLPEGTTIRDVVILGQGLNQWIELPTYVVGANIVALQLSELYYSPFIPVVVRPLREGQIFIESDPGASVYIGLRRAGRTPAVIDRRSLSRSEAQALCEWFQRAVHHRRRAGAALFQLQSDARAGQ
jgi:hypothetical protein